MKADPSVIPDCPVLDPANPMPRYLQVRDWLAGRIESGLLEKGAKLPAEKEWAPALGVSQMTLNHAIQALVKEGLVFREVGRGTFVTDHDPVAEPVHIGLVLHWRKESDGGHYGTTMLHGIYHVAAEQPARFSFAWGDPSEDEPQDYYIRLAADHQVDGLLLLIPPAHALPQMLALQEAGIPFIVVGASWESYALPCVDFDNNAGAELAVRHLLTLGHRRIGLVNGAMYLRSTLARTNTFHRVLQSENIHFHPDWEITASSFTMDAESAGKLKTLLRSSDGPTAYFAAGYYLCTQTVEMIQGVGRRIPDDISVVGFGDPFTAAYMSPPLTTIRHPIEALGELAVERLLIGVREGRSGRETDLQPVEFVERRSTSQPKHA